MDDELLEEFLAETNERLEAVGADLVRFEREPCNAEILDNIFRMVHTVKGTCGFLNLPRLEKLAHAAESLMSKFRNGSPVTAEAVTVVLAAFDRIKVILQELELRRCEPQGADTDLIASLGRIAQEVSRNSSNAQAAGTLLEPQFEPELESEPEPDPELALQELARELGQRRAEVRDRTEVPETADEGQGGSVIGAHTIRVKVDTLENLMTMVSELVLTRNQLLDVARRNDDSEFNAPLQRLSGVTTELQDGVMRARMQPIHNAWQALPRIVRDLAIELGKGIELEFHGADTELDRQVLEAIKDPLTHMVRNSVDHGIEPRSQRIAAGKPPKGTIRLNAYQEGGYIVIGIADDGRGLNTARIRDKVSAQGLATEAELEKMSDQQVQKFIFMPGFTTSREVTNYSGRGVGMDVVRSNIERIGGSIEVHSVPGKGLSVKFRIPLTLAIVSVLIIESCGDRFAIPQHAVTELVRIRPGSEHRIEYIKDAAVLRLRNRLLPLVHLGGLLRLADARANAEKSFIVVMQVAGQSFGVIVDAIFHTEEVVVKPLASKLRQIAVFCGSTILGDGSVIMILDSNGVSNAASLTMLSDTAGREGAETDDYAAADDNVSLLVFRAGTPEPKAIPLSLVTRLEEIDCRKIEMSNGRHMVQYGGQLMPLMRINEDVVIKSDGAQSLLVFSDGQRSMGLVVDEVIDIVEDKLEIWAGTEGNGVLGSAIIRGQATEIIDIGHFLPQAYADWFRRKDPHESERERTLLLVDDSPFFRNMLGPVLKAAGYRVTAVGSAKEALDALRSGRAFDALVTDVDMPEMDGLALAQAVRAEQKFLRLPIIGLSASSSPEAIERGRQAGFYNYVAKFDRHGLIAALKQQVADTDRAA
jgi:two-component system, chemotaxis family, sensor kinase CheA